MKTIVGFTMGLATLVFATAADAQDRRCFGRGISGVPAGTPCVFGPSRPRAPLGFEWRGMMLYSTEIIERPHNGTAVLRADGGTYYNPKPGFTGKDSMTVRYTEVAPIL